jgi:hypothetical protein
MPKGPLGGDRLTSVGPFTYDESQPPEVPGSFEPPSEITNAQGDFIWYKNWQDSPLSQYGLTGLYDVNNDRMIVDNRQPNETFYYTHDEMVRDIIEKSPFPKFPSAVVPAEAGGFETQGVLKLSAEIPTAAGGAFVATERLDEDKEIIEKKDPAFKTNMFYKYVYTLAKIDYPEDTTVRMSHRLGRRMGQFFVAERQFDLSDAYRELQFAGQLPEPKVSPS